MLQPGTLALVLVLVGAGAGAQPSPGPALRQRSLTVTGNPAEPVPEVRGAKLVNVLVHKDTGAPVLIDFGCATHAHAEELTDAPAPPGTPRYQAPQVERFLRENRNKPGARYPFQVADELFSLGVMLYEVLTEPRPTEQSARPLLNSLWRPPTRPREKNPRVPVALSDLAMSLLERDPDRRPEDAETLDRELADLESHKGPEYDETAHPPSTQRTPADEASNVLPFSTPQPPGLAGRLALRVRALASRGLRWHKGLALGSAGAALGLMALLALLALWPQAEQQPASPTPEPAATAPASDAGPSSRGTDAPGALEKKGSPVMTQKPDAPIPPPTPRPQKPQRGAHTAEFLGWCKSFAILGTVTAVASGCPGAQVRPEPFQCPEGAWELMHEKWQWDSDGIAVRIDDRHPLAKSAWYQSGPVVGVSDRELQQERSKKPVPLGTRFIGHLWLVPESTRDGFAGHFVVRYDRVEFPNGENMPVCLLVGRNLDHVFVELKDGSGRISQPTHRAVPVYRWKPERPK